MYVTAQTSVYRLRMKVPGQPVRFDQRYLRPPEVDELIGDASKAAHDLGWKATVSALDLARLMVDADVAALEHGAGWVDRPQLADWPLLPF